MYSASSKSKKNLSRICAYWYDSQIDILIEYTDYISGNITRHKRCAKFFENSPQIALDDISTHKV